MNLFFDTVIILVTGITIHNSKRTKTFSGFEINPQDLLSIEPLENAIMIRNKSISRLRVNWINMRR